MIHARPHNAHHLAIFATASLSVFALGAAGIAWFGAQLVVRALRLTVVGLFV
ncbi:MAG: hypothetical protein L6R19_17320 [Alphaproteobacteria bacterium]|nr:hypothetical protein [Alphaproteobacteria bacterium]